MKYKYLPYNKNLRNKAREMRNEMTLAEKKLWYEYLRMNEDRFLRQKLIGNYIVDFYCSKLKLVIEIDGSTHISNEDMKHDLERSRALEKFGLKILRFWNNEIFEGFEFVTEKIEQEITNLKSPKPPLSRGLK